MLATIAVRAFSVTPANQKKQEGKPKSQQSSGLAESRSGAPLRCSAIFLSRPPALVIRSSDLRPNSRLCVN